MSIPGSSSPERWRQVRGVLGDAQELPRAEVEAFLERACGGDRELRREVEELLAADGAAAGLLAVPAAEVAADLLDDGTAEGATADPLAGRELGPYRLIRRIGSGGMGEVYLGRDTRLERSVAVKLLPPEWSRDAVARERFLLEARTVSVLDHPNIATLYDLGTSAEGRLFLVMAFYPGETLRRRLARGPLEVLEAVELAMQVGRGLAHAHQAGIVHRDVKPANVLITARGEAKILDFGIAKIAGAVGLTRTDAVLGTPAYLSPEQARGEPVDARTDIFSLGAMLYEMIGGCKAFPAEDPQAAIHSVLHLTPVPLSRLRPGVPAELEQIVARSLAKHPEARYPDIAALLHDLDTSWLATLPREPPPSPGLGRHPLASPAPLADWRPAPEQPIPRRPNWVLAERLGEGGFGEVWLARHRSGETRVFKFCSDASRLRALKREVTFFRLLKETLGNRQDIARILDWNFDQPPYYLESEYTEGGNLVDWAAREGGLASIALATRLALAAEVADALAAAHSVGILHKDVKPENVLIASDREGRPHARLADFGIGRLVDPQALAEPGFTVLGFTARASTGGDTSGTVRYMAPELLEGKPATTQADLYSLGVLLYQLVAGDFSRALAPGWQREVADELLAEDLASFVDGRPERRPASALEVAELLRTLEQRRAARAERAALERMARRRRLATWVAAAALAVLAVVGFMALRERQARQTAALRQRQAEDLISFMLGDLRRKLEPVGRLEVLDDVGAKAMRYFAAVPVAELSDDELARRSQALYQVGDVRTRQGRLAEAIAPLEESLKLAQALADRDPDNARRLFDLAQSHFWLGSARRQEGELGKAREQFLSYFELARRLVEQEPENREWQMELAYAYTNLGAVEEAGGDLAAAGEAIRSSVEIKQRLAAGRPTDRELGASLASGHSWLARMLEKQGELRAALAEYQRERARREDLAARSPEDAKARHSLTTSLSHVADLHLFLGEARAALAELQRMQGLLRGLTALDPDNGDWRRDLAVCHQQLAEARLALADRAGAAAELAEARTLLAELGASHSQNVDWRRDAAAVDLDLAALAFARGDHATAGREAEASRRVLAGLLERQAEDRLARGLLAHARLLSGRIASATGNYTQALAAWNEARETVEPQARRSSDPVLLAPWAEAAHLLGSTAEAAAVLRRLRATGYARPGFVHRLELKGAHDD